MCSAVESGRKARAFCGRAGLLTMAAAGVPERKARNFIPKDRLKCAISPSKGNHMKKAVLAFALVAVLATPSFAQSVGEKTGVNSTLGIAPKTEDFIKESAMSDMTEIESAKIAQQKGNAEEKMLADHTKTSTELKTFGLRLQSQLYQPADGFGHVQRTYTI
jgi:hypothetical protein